MRVGWVQDGGNADGTQGGAELSAAEFRAAAPDGVELVDCPAGQVDDSLDRYVVHNCVEYRAADLAGLEDRCVKYLHDLWPHGDPILRERLLAEARRLVFCGPGQAQTFGLEGDLVPPAIDLNRFVAADRPRHRAGSVAVGPWMNPGKAPWRAAEWAEQNQVEISYLGGGPFAPDGSEQIAHHRMPDLLARFEYMVHLPMVPEPFGRGVVEALAAGCEIVTNQYVGAGWWIAEQPDELDTAGEDFWAAVLR